ncbi:MAG: T9SS type A sorting domain-containing protein [Candidatus Zixiibacteriota bacterium]|nr:MAG: T9SS type A sorting domain-containing protein [candidate division Zixibacteria bacterium]
MKTRFFLSVTIPLLFLFSIASGQGISLDNVEGLYGPDTIRADGSTPIVFNLRLEGMSSDTSGGFTAGFEVSSPDGAEWGGTDVEYCYNGTPTWEEIWDVLDGAGGYFECPVNVDGVGADTIGLGALAVYHGLPDGFSAVAFSITIGPINTEHSGKTITLDSCFYPPNGYWILAGSGGNFSWGGPYTFTLFDPMTAVASGDDVNLPRAFALNQNYPNPFNPTTELIFDVPHRSHVRIAIFNVLGQKVRTLVDEVLAAGSYARSWDGTGDAGNSLSSGVYLYTMEAGEHVQTRKMILLK